MKKQKTDMCSTKVIHKDIIEKVQRAIPANEILYELSSFFKTLGDETRVKILIALSKSEMCVCDIAALFDMTDSAISHQLRILKQPRLVKFRKEGQIVYYSLDDEHVEQVFKQGLKHITE
jgi:ArsR family transcriptional regulator